MRKLLPVFAALALVAAWAPGCARLWRAGRPDIVFPTLNSAREQFRYAADFDANTLVGSGKEKGDERLRRIIAVYQMVVDHFPGDPIYAPLAEAEIANTYFRMKDYRRTIRLFQSLQARCPDYPFIHAEAAWMIGRSHDMLGESVEAKAHYKRCIDTFQHSKNDLIQTYVALCRNAYIQPSVPGKPRK